MNIIVIRSYVPTPETRDELQRLIFVDDVEKAREVFALLTASFCEPRVEQALVISDTLH